MQPLGLLHRLPDAVLVIDPEARLLWANRTAEETFGWTLTEWRGEPVDILCHPDDLATALASLESVTKKDVGTPIELRFRDRAGTYRGFEVRGRAATAEDGIEGIVLVLRELTERGRWEVHGGDAELYRRVLDTAPAITMILDREGRVRGASRALTTLLGRDLEGSLGRHLREFVTGADALTLEAELALAAAEPGQRTFEASFTTKDGSASVPMSLTVVNLLDDRTVNGLVVSAADITSLAESRARLHHLANHDQLTGLPNRTAFTERLQTALSTARRRQSSVSLLYCDVDDFKSVNDRHGHLAGDHVLRQIAERLLSVTRASDSVARMGGDEFVVLLEEADLRAQQALLGRLRAVVGAPIDLPGGATVSVTVTVGSATAEGTADVDDLLGRADAAMYSAKRRVS